MSYKRLTPSIFISQGKAVKWFDDSTIVSEDVIGLAKQYCERGADEMIVFDLSNSDEEHDEFIEGERHPLALVVGRQVGRLACDNFRRRLVILSAVG